MFNAISKLNFVFALNFYQIKNNAIAFYLHIFIKIFAICSNHLSKRLLDFNIRMFWNTVAD